MKESGPAIPRRCINCPVLGRYAVLGRVAQIEDQTRTKAALKYLDKAELKGGTLNGDVLKAIGQSAADVAYSSYDRRQRLTEQQSIVVAAMVTGTCPGSTRGTGETGLWAVLDYVTGERSCHNPDFASIKQDSDIALQLKLGNWIDPS